MIFQKSSVLSHWQAVPDKWRTSIVHRGQWVIYKTSSMFQTFFWAERSKAPLSGASPKFQAESGLPAFFICAHPKDTNAKSQV